MKHIIMGIAIIFASITIANANPVFDFSSRGAQISIHVGMSFANANPAFGHGSNKIESNVKTSLNIGMSVNKIVSRYGLQYAELLISVHPGPDEIWKDFALFSAGGMVANFITEQIVANAESSQIARERLEAAARELAGAAGKAREALASAKRIEAEAESIETKAFWLKTKDIVEYGRLTNEVKRLRDEARIEAREKEIRILQRAAESIAEDAAKQ